MIELIRSCPRRCRERYKISLSKIIFQVNVSFCIYRCSCNIVVIAVISVYSYNEVGCVT